MDKHGGISSRHDKHVTPAAISPPSVAWGRFVGGHQSVLAGCKSPLIFKRGASSCSSQRQRQRNPKGASPRPSAPTYLPTCVATLPTSGPLLILPPALRRWGAPRRQGLRSHLAHKWANCDSAPRSEVVGILEAAGVAQPPCPQVGHF